MNMSEFNIKKRDIFVDLLIKNKGNYIYYIEFTDEIRLSTKKYPNGNLILALDEIAKIELGSVTYVGKL